MCRRCLRRTEWPFYGAEYRAAARIAAGTVTSNGRARETAKDADSDAADYSNRVPTVARVVLVASAVSGRGAAFTVPAAAASATTADTEITTCLLTFTTTSWSSVCGTIDSSPAAMPQCGVPQRCIGRGSTGGEISGGAV